MQSLYFLNPKFQAYSYLLWLCNPVCVGPGRKPLRPLFSQRGLHSSNSLLKAYVQVKLSCGSYILQSVRARFNQFQVSKLCPLCREADETLQHFILHCGVLEQTRHSFINEIRKLVGSVNNEKLLGLILDPSTAGVHEENHDSHWETRIFSLT